MFEKIWSALALLVIGYLVGSHRQELAHAKADAAAAEAVAAAAERYREAERNGQKAAQSLTAAADEEKRNAEKQMEALRADVRRGAVRLSIAVDQASATRAAAVAAAGDREARADLLPEAADHILSFAREGGDVVRELNLCIDKYHVAETMMQRAAP